MKVDPSDRMQICGGPGEVSIRCCIAALNQIPRPSRPHIQQNTTAVTAAERWRPGERRATSEAPEINAARRIVPRCAGDEQAIANPAGENARRDNQKMAAKQQARQPHTRLRPGGSRPCRLGGCRTAVGESGAAMPS